MGETQEGGKVRGGCIGLDGDLDIKAFARSLLGACQYRATLTEVCQDLDALIAQCQLLLGRSLRHLREQSEGHPGYEVGERCWCRTLPAGHVVAFVADQGEAPAVWLAGDDLLAPTLNRLRFGEDLDVANSLRCFGILFRVHAGAISFREGPFPHSPNRVCLANWR
jgi:hypothetical protein